jgi:RNA polymerase sigma factor (sigma-70 family)
MDFVVSAGRRGRIRLIRSETNRLVTTSWDMRQTQRAGPDAALLAAAQRGDREAFARLYERYVGDVYRYALRMLRHTAAAEDMTQDVFTLAWANRADIRIADLSLLPWLLVTTRNLSLNRLKRLDRRVELHDAAQSADPRPGPEDVVLDRQLADSIADAVARLSETDQRLYRLCIVDELSYRDAASALGTTTGVVRNRLSRLRRALQLSLAPQKEGLS